MKVKYWLYISYMITAVTMFTLGIYVERSYIGPGKSLSNIKAPSKFNSAPSASEIDTSAILHYVPGAYYPQLDHVEDAIMVTQGGIYIYIDRWNSNAKDREIDLANRRQKARLFIQNRPR